MMMWSFFQGPGKTKRNHRNQDSPTIPHHPLLSDRAPPPSEEAMVRSKQLSAFEAQLQLASELQLPVNVPWVVGRRSSWGSLRWCGERGLSFLFLIPHPALFGCLVGCWMFADVCLGFWK